MELKEYGKAVAMLDECKPSKTKDADELAACNYLYAKILQINGNTTAAAERYGRAYNYAENKNIKEEALFKQSEINLGRKRYFEARAGFKTFLKSFPKSKYAAAATNGLAICLDETGAYDEALQYLGKAGETPEILFRRANILQQTGKYKEAEKDYAKAASKGMGYLLKDDKTRYYYGENLFINGNKKKALGFLIMVKGDKYKGKAQLYAAMASMDDSKPEKVIDMLTDATKSHDSGVQKKAYLNLLQVYIKHDMPDKSKEAFQNLKALFMTEDEKSQFRKAHMKVADLYMDRDMPAKAAEVLHNIQGMYMTDDEKAQFMKSKLKLADTYMDAGMLDKAEEVLQGFKEQHMSDDEKNQYKNTNLKLIDSYINKGKVKEAKKMVVTLKDMNLIDGDSAEVGKAYLKIAKNQMEKGVLNEAKEMLDVLKSMHLKENEKNELNLIDVKMNLKEKKYKDMIEAMLPQLKKSPKSAQLLEALENIMKDALTGDKKEFAALWGSYGSYLLDTSREKFLFEVRDALKGQGKPYIDLLIWFSKNAASEGKYNALRELSDVSLKAGDKTAAVKYLGQLKGLNISADEINRLEAEMFYSSGDFKNAILKIMDIKELKKEDMKLINDTIGQIDDKVKGAAFFEKAVTTLGGTQSDYVLLADMYANAGKKDLAMKYYKQIVQTDPGNERALYGIVTNSSGAEADEALKKLSLVNSTLGNYAKSILQQKELDNKLEGKP